MSDGPALFIVAWAGESNKLLRDGLRWTEKVCNVADFRFESFGMCRVVEGIMEQILTEGSSTHRLGSVPRCELNNNSHIIFIYILIEIYPEINYVQYLLKVKSLKEKEVTHS